MAPKITCSFQPSSSYFFEDFSTQAQETNLDLFYSNRELFSSHYVDEDLFKNFSFIEAFTIVELRNFIFEKPQERYPKLVKIFYTNLSYKDGIISSEVKKHPITLSLEDFDHEYNLPFIEQDYDQMDLEGNKFNFDTLAHSLLIDPTSIIPTPFNIGLINTNIGLIHYTMNHVFFPRKANHPKIRHLCHMVLRKQSPKK